MYISASTLLIYCMSKQARQPHTRYSATEFCHYKGGLNSYESSPMYNRCLAYGSKNRYGTTHTQSFRTSSHFKTQFAISMVFRLVFPSQQMYKCHKAREKNPSKQGIVCVFYSKFVKRCLVLGHDYHILGHTDVSTLVEGRMVSSIKILSVWFF